MALFTGVQHLSTFDIVSSLFITFSQMFETRRTQSLLMFHIDRPIPGPSQWFFHFGEEIVITWPHIGWVRWIFQNIPLPAAQDVRDSSSGITPCIVMKNDGVLNHQVSSFSPEQRTKVVLQECAVIAFTVWLGRTAWCSINPTLSYATMNLTFTVHCAGSTFFGREQGCFHSFDWRFKFDSYQRAQGSTIATIRSRKSSPCLCYRSIKACPTA